MNLELWRKTKRERKMTYQDIADISEIPLGTIKNIFAGYTPDPRESTIKAIESALGVETVLTPKAKEFLTPEEKELLKDFRSLPRQEKAQATAYVHYLAEKRGDTNKRA